MPHNAWAIPGLALLAYALIVFFGRRFGERAAFIPIIALGGSFVLAVINLLAVIGGATAEVRFDWLHLGERTITMGYRVGPVEAVVLFMVTLVSLMVLLFSKGYMHGDAKFNRFFANVTLFITGMLLLVIADNFLLFLVAWEVMGLCSYLLIGHWFEDLDNAKAAMKAFLTTRLGDVGLMLGVWMLFLATGSFRFDEITKEISKGQMDVAFLTLAALALFSGAVGKSAQVPLHIWLPDAMAGPTPVSALIHAATMVAAGVFLVARSFPIFQAAPDAMLTVAVIGAITALMAALIATVQTDIKKSLAYSTVSQLGFMMLALGVGGFAAGIFHLLTHAFFKALLFLGSGSVIHAAHTQEMHKMGGLFRKLPVTGATFIIGTLALAGIPPLAGFFSKDEILLEAFHFERAPILFWMAVFAAFLTAYYMTRSVILTFFGKPRDHHVYDHAHESPPIMALPLLILAVPAVFAGLAGAPFAGSWLQHFIDPHVHLPEPSGFVQNVAIGVSVAGIVVAFLIYQVGILNRQAAIRVLKPVYVLFKQKFYFDHVAMGIVAVTVAISRFVATVDKWVVDGLVNGLGWFVFQMGQGARRFAAGSAQAYAMVMALAIAVGLFVYQAMGG